MRPRRYLELDLPKRFELQVMEEDGIWSTFAVAGCADFERLEDGSYVCTKGGRPVFLRALEVHTDHFLHVDGQDSPFNYRVVATGRTESP